MKNHASTKPKVRFLGWRMVGLACLCVNVGVGFTFGAYSTFMSSIVTEFSASRSLASGGLSLMVATMGLSAPLASYAVQRWSIRATLITGTVLMATGWVVVGTATNIWYFIFGFGILCGTAAAFLIVVPPMTLINNWFVALRGRAVGVSMISILLTIVPTLAALGITAFGWRNTALSISVISLALAPLMLLVIDHPDAVGQTALGAESAEPRNSAMDGVEIVADKSNLLLDPVLWILILCGGFYGAAGVSLGAHLVPFAIGRGLDLSAAAFLASIFGFAALVGGFVSGMVADRIGGARTFAIMAFVQFSIWPCLFLSDSYSILAVCFALIGLCANAMMPVVTTLVANVFGRERFARAMALFSILTTPLSILLPLVVGALYDVSGSYRQVFLIYAALFGVVGITFCFMYRVEINRQAVPGMTAVALAHGE